MRKKYFGDKAFYKMALLVAVPIMIQNGVTNFVSLLDNIMVGAVGTIQMTGVSIANTLIFVFNLAVFGAVSGAGIFCAQFYGKGDFEGVRHTFRFKLMVCGVLALIGIVVFWLFGESLISLYLQGEGKPEEIAASLQCGKQYLRIMLLSIPVFVVEQCYASTLRETGETVLPMKAGVTAVCVNVCFNWLLIFGKLCFPALGANGAAAATVLSRYVEAAIVISWTHRHTDRNPAVKGLYRSFRVPAGLAKDITLRGLPLILNETLWALGVAILNQCYSIRGYDVVPAANIASTVSNVCNVAFLAMGSAIGIIVGQLLGAGETEKAKEVDRRLIVFSELTCLLFGSVMAAISGVFPRLFDATNEVRSLATKFILISAVLMPVNSFSNACYFTLRSGGKTLVTFLFDSVYACVIVAPVAYCLSRFTAMPIVPLYFCCQGMELGKCVVGAIMVRSGIWVQNIVKEESSHACETT